MDKLIQTIQDEINQLMNSRFAKRTDKQLAYQDKKMISPKTIELIKNEYLKGYSINDIEKKYDVCKQTISKYLKEEKIEIDQQRSIHEKKRKISKTEEKLEDIKNGFELNDFVIKWNCPKHSYYYYKKKHLELSN
jgi:transposase